MRYKIFITWMACLFAVAVFAQQPTNKPIRIADSLTTQEKNNRNVILLKSELDSLVKLYSPPVQLQKDEPKKAESSGNDVYLLGASAIILLLLALLVVLFIKHQQRMSNSIKRLQRQLQQQDPLPPPVKEAKNGKAKVSQQSLENKISDLNSELHRLTKENEGLNRVVKEYNGIQHDYDSLKHRISKSYKVKNYPGYDKSKEEPSHLQGVLDTESSVAAYAYEKFLKPILAITDTNKNNPARISDEDRQRLVDLLVSLSLLYTEYLYLRVNDLSIGGKMVERIQGFSKGNGLNPSLLKKLNTDHGSRALALRIALDKSGIHKLSYPVFDETDLNNP